VIEEEGAREKRVDVGEAGGGGEKKGAWEGAEAGGEGETRGRGGGRLERGILIHSVSSRKKGPIPNSNGSPVPQGNSAGEKNSGDGGSEALGIGIS
jgi:hypothetical protein